MSGPLTNARFCAIVMAAGRSSRFSGGHKLLAEVEGQPLIRRTLQAAASSRVTDIVLVLAPETAAAISRAAGDGRWRASINANAADGLSTSLRAGLEALPQGVDGALVLLGDMPGVTTRLIDHVLDAAAANPGAIVHPVTPDGAQGHPVLWPSGLFGDLAALQGDKGAKSLLARHHGLAVTVPADQSASLDIDTAEDLAAFMNVASSRTRN